MTNDACDPNSSGKVKLCNITTELVQVEHSGDQEGGIAVPAIQYFQASASTTDVVLCRRNLRCLRTAYENGEVVWLCQPLLCDPEHTVQSWCMEFNIERTKRKLTTRQQQQQIKTKQQQQQEA